MIIRLSREHVNALLACITRDDVRFYLHGIACDFKNKVAVATNGHVLVKVPLEFVGDSEGRDDVVVYDMAQKPLVKKCSYIELDTETKILTRFTDSALQIERTVVNEIDGKFPDYEKVLAKPQSEKIAVAAPSFNPLLITPIQKALGAVNVRFLFTDSKGGSILAEFAGHPDVHCTFMPCRW